MPNELFDGLEAAAELFETANEVYVLGASAVGIVAGLVVAHFGRTIYKIVTFLVGFVPGALLGGGLGVAAGGEAGALLGGLLGGVVSGALAVWLAFVIPGLVGFLLVFVPAVAWLQPDGWEFAIPAILGLLGGWLASLLFNLLLIVGTAVGGASMVAVAVYALLETFSGDVVGFAARMVVAAVVFLLIAATGTVRQYRAWLRSELDDDDEEEKEVASSVVERRLAGHLEGALGGSSAAAARARRGRRHEPRPMPAASVAALPETPVAPAGAWCLVGAGRRNMGETVAIGSELLVGRDVDRGLRLDDPAVSRRHARLEALADGGLRLTDLGSTNGTWVNDARVVEGVLLREGDRLRFHDVGFRVARHSA